MNNRKNLITIILVLLGAMIILTSCCISGYCAVDSSSQNTYKTETKNIEK